MDCRLPIADCRLTMWHSRPRLCSTEGRSASLPTAYRPPLTARAFTLVEVLVAIVIALLLIVGISKIFGLAQQASGMGTTLTAQNGTVRTIESVLRSDFQYMLTDFSTGDAPGLVIASYAASAFRNVQDFQLGPDPNRPLVFPPTGGGSSANPAWSQSYSTNYRVHRLDRMCFFERSQFQRQTGDPFTGGANLVANGPLASQNEAFVWFGHLEIPNNTALTSWDPNQPDTPGAGDYFGPNCTQGSNFANGTSGNNDNNKFASSWILGRQVILLANGPPPTPTSGTSFFVDAGLGAPAGTVPLSLLVPSPLSTVQGTAKGTSHPVPVYASRTDILFDNTAQGDPMSTFHTIIKNLPGYTASADGFFWWEDLCGLTATQIGGGIPRVLVSPPCQSYFANPLPTKPVPPTSGASSPGYATFSGNPAAWYSAAAAQTAPIFVRGCTQFIVEFAGDYAKQDPNTGALTGPGQDGQIDYIVDNTDPLHPQRRIRWYGFPRDTGSPSPNGNPNTPDGPPVPDGLLGTSDVIPVQWYLGPKNRQLFERAVPTLSTSLIPPSSNVAPFNVSAAPNIQPELSPAYICAWGPDVPVQFKPKLIRITIAIDEPTGRLNTEQTYEFIYVVP